jgi:hypothetical protein
MRGRGCAQQQTILAIDREFPTLSFREFLRAAGLRGDHPLISLARGKPIGLRLDQSKQTEK